MLQRIATAVPQTARMNSWTCLVMEDRLCTEEIVKCKEEIDALFNLIESALWRYGGYQKLIFCFVFLVLSLRFHRLLVQMLVFYFYHKWSICCMLARLILEFGVLGLLGERKKEGPKQEESSNIGAQLLRLSNITSFYFVQTTFLMMSQGWRKLAYKGLLKCIHCIMYVFMHHCMHIICMFVCICLWTHLVCVCVWPISV